MCRNENKHTRAKKKKERNNNSFPFIAKRALDISNTENYSGYSRRDDGSHSMHPLACVCMCVCVYGLSVNSVASRLSLLAFLRHDRQSYMFIVKVKKKKKQTEEKAFLFRPPLRKQQPNKRKKKAIRVSLASIFYQLKRTAVVSIYLFTCFSFAGFVRRARAFSAVKRAQFFYVQTVRK